MPPTINLQDRLLSDSLEKKLTNLHFKSETLQTCVQQLIEANKKTYTIDSMRNFTINLSGVLTFLPIGKESNLALNQISWSSKNRTSGKFGKIFKKLFDQLKIVISPQDLEKLVNHMKASVNSNCNFEIVEGSEIPKIYSQGSIALASGSLNESCMNGKPKRYFKLYNDNCKMLISRNEAKEITGRALLWETVCKTKIMDRIYGNDETIQRFKNWAIENKYLHKAVQSYKNKTTFIDKKGEIEKIFAIKISASSSQEFPYIDTFTFAKLELNYLTNNADSGRFIFSRTSGGYELNGIFWDYHKECYIHESDAVYCRGEFIGYTHKSNVVVTYRGEYIITEDSVVLDDEEFAFKNDNNIAYIEGDNVYTYKSNCKYCVWDNKYILSKNAIFIEETGKTVHKDCEEKYIQSLNLNKQAAEVA